MNIYLERVFIAQHFLLSTAARTLSLIRGQHHAVSGKYLASYARHAAWLEDHSSESNGALADRLIRAALTVPVSRTWSGYWQRRAS